MQQEQQRSEWLPRERELLAKVGADTHPHIQNCAAVGIKLYRLPGTTENFLSNRFSLHHLGDNFRRLAWDGLCVCAVPHCWVRAIPVVKMFAGNKSFDLGYISPQRKFLSRRRVFLLAVVEEPKFIYYSVIWFLDSCIGFWKRRVIGLTSPQENCLNLLAEKLIKSYIWNTKQNHPPVVNRFQNILLAIKILAEIIFIETHSIIAANSRIIGLCGYGQAKVSYYYIVTSLLKITLCIHL